MKRLLKYFNGFKKECALGPLFKLFEATLELIVPLIIAHLLFHQIYGLHIENLGICQNVRGQSQSQFE